jgi:hypothetical protein
VKLSLSLSLTSPLSLQVRRLPEIACAHRASNSSTNSTPHSAIFPGLIEYGRLKDTDHVVQVTWVAMKYYKKTLFFINIIMYYFGYAGFEVPVGRCGARFSALSSQGIYPKHQFPHRFRNSSSGKLGSRFRPRQ